MQFTQKRRPHDEVLASYNKIKEFLNNSEELTAEQKTDLGSLFEYLETKTEWLTAFCSTRFHCSYEGGVLEHSVNAANAMRKQCKAFFPQLKEVDCIIAALLHDCGKAGNEEGGYYKQGEPTPKQKQYGYPGSMTTNKDIPFMRHAHRSLWLISKFYKLTEEQTTAIALHDEWFTKDHNDFFNYTPMTDCLAWADMYACKYMDEPGN